MKLRHIEHNPGELAVAPRVGAWIETRKRRCRWAGSRSRPAWARGLKRLVNVSNLLARYASRPAWARGLKPLLIDAGDVLLLSRPAWARGLKRILPV